MVKHLATTRIMEAFVKPIVLISDYMVPGCRKASRIACENSALSECGSLSDHGETGVNAFFVMSKFVSC